MNLRFRIVQDVDFTIDIDFENDEAETAYNDAFDRGSLVAVGIEVEREAQPCQHCGRGSSWEHVASLWGIDVPTENFTDGDWTCKRDQTLNVIDGDGWYALDSDEGTSILALTDEQSYLSSVLRELVAEAQAA